MADVSQSAAVQNSTLFVAMDNFKRSSVMASIKITGLACKVAINMASIDK